MLYTQSNSRFDVMSLPVCRLHAARKMCLFSPTIIYYACFYGNSPEICNLREVTSHLILKLDRVSSRLLLRENRVSKKTNFQVWGNPNTLRKHRPVPNHYQTDQQVLQGNEPRLQWCATPVWPLQYIQHCMMGKYLPLLYIVDALTFWCDQYSMYALGQARHGIFWQWDYSISCFHLGWITLNINQVILYMYSMVKMTGLWFYTFIHDMLSTHMDFLFT